jgi:hypothetical protein
LGAIESETQRNADNTVRHAEIKIGDSLILLGQAGGQWKPLGGAFYLWAKNVDEVYARVGQRRYIPRSRLRASQCRRQCKRP